MADLIAVFALAVIIFLCLMFAKYCIRLRKTGGTMTTTVHGALDSFYHKEKKKAVEMVVEQQAHKKMDEQSNSDSE